MEIIHFFRLSKGMNRIFIVLGIIIFFLTLFITWQDVIKAEKRYRNNVYDGITIYAWGKAVAVIDGKKTELGPFNLPTAHGWASWICLADEGHRLQVTDHKAQWPLSFLELRAIMTSQEYLECVKTIRAESKMDLLAAKVRSIFLSLLSVMCLYIGLLVTVKVTKWITEGFKSS